MQEVNRRKLFKVLGSIIGALIFPLEKLRSLTFPKLSYAQILWYENSNGDRWIPMSGNPDPPIGFKYMCIREVRDIRETTYGPDGLITVGNSTWNESLVLEMLKHGYKLQEAMIISSIMCERCLNGYAHEFGLKWGYPIGSTKWKKSNTQCEFCCKELQKKVTFEKV